MASGDLSDLQFVLTDSILLVAHTCRFHIEGRQPITLNYFALKTLKRLLDEYLRPTIERAVVSDSEHTYIKQKFTKNTFHGLMDVMLIAFQKTEN